MQGLAKQVLLLLLDLLRNEGATRAVGETFDDHDASRGVMERARMCVASRRREDIDREERDPVVYEITR